MPSARDVLVDRARRDVQDSLAYLRERLRREPRGLMRGLELGVLGLVSLVNPEARIGHDVDKVVAVARRHLAGEPAAALASEALHETLGTRELALVVRVKEPAFQHVLDVAERVFRERLPDFSRMISVEEPADYPDLVRRAFPDRALVERIVAENAKDVVELIAHFRAHPHLLRLPRSWVPKATLIADEMVAWKLVEVAREVDDIYGADSGGP